MCFAKSSQTLPRLTLHEKCLYSDFFWSAFSRIRTEHGDLLCKFPYLDRFRESTDQKNSEFEHLLQSVSWEDFFHCFHDSYCSWNLADIWLELSSSVDDFEQRIEAHIFRMKKHFSLIFSPLFSKSASTFKKLFQFKKWEIWYELLLKISYLVRT